MSLMGLSCLSKAERLTASISRWQNPNDQPKPCGAAVLSLGPLADEALCEDARQLFVQSRMVSNAFVRFAVCQRSTSRRGLSATSPCIENAYQKLTMRVIVVPIARDRTAVL